MIDEFKIIKNGNRDYVVKNIKGEYENHGHVKRYETAKLLIRLINKKIVPKSLYLQNAALRLTTDEKYKEKLLNKQAKNKNKQQYFNVNKGI